MGPFKGKLHVAQLAWMTANPGKVITINDLASLTNDAHQASFTAKKVIAALLSLVYCHSQDFLSMTRILSHHL
jgi:hypothetical protein